jgi:hypothetical protein
VELQSEELLQLLGLLTAVGAFVVAAEGALGACNR